MPPGITATPQSPIEPVYSAGKKSQWHCLRPRHPLCPLQALVVRPVIATAAVPLLWDSRLYPVRRKQRRDHQQNLAPPPAPLGAAAPATPEEEEALLTTLRTQLHFVRSIQSVDTMGVAPLAAVRDETARGRREQTIGLEALKEALAREDVVGHSRRPRRRRVEQEEGQRNEAEDWDVLAGASETAGRYFVVRSGKGGEAQ
ncbi:hypothetical protein PG994_001326 [Apiospora phragmitis]|uniref:Uncharacterized protein n=1 Tax=Apiospora phragmitis TaxID=2905665 RepID=A0ABR1WT92_9PEZI